MTDWILDTHAWIWMASDEAQIPERIRKTLRSRKRPRLRLSMASVWELTIKQALGRADLPIRVSELVRLSHEKLGLIALPIEFRHLEVLGDLSLDSHRDPFDRLLVAQAIAESATLLSRDLVLDKYSGLKRVWD